MFEERSSAATILSPFSGIKSQLRLDQTLQSMKKFMVVREVFFYPVLSAAGVGVARSGGMETRDL